MNVIAFLGSPRKGGNTEILLKEAIRGTGLDVRVFNLCRMRISPCINCGSCEQSGLCEIGDDMQKIYTAIREADRIIFASPIFFMGISAQAKTMVDRCQAVWCEKYLLKKPIEQGTIGRKGLLLLVGGMKISKGIECAEATAAAFFRTVSVPHHVTLAYKEVDKKGEIFNHPTAMKDAFEAGRKLVE